MGEKQPKTSFFYSVFDNIKVKIVDHFAKVVVAVLVLGPALSLWQSLSSNQNVWKHFLVWLVVVVLFLVFRLVAESRRKSSVGRKKSAKRWELFLKVRRALMQMSSSGKPVKKVQRTSRIDTWLDPWVGISGVILIGCGIVCSEYIEQVYRAIPWSPPELRWTMTLDGEYAGSGIMQEAGVFQVPPISRPGHMVCVVYRITADGADVEWSRFERDVVPGMEPFAYNFPDYRNPYVDYGANLFALNTCVLTKSGIRHRHAIMSRLAGFQGILIVEGRSCELEFSEKSSNSNAKLSLNRSREAHFHDEEGFDSHRVMFAAFGSHYASHDPAKRAADRCVRVVALIPKPLEEIYDLPEPPPQMTCQIDWAQFPTQEQMLGSFVGSLRRTMHTDGLTPWPSPQISFLTSSLPSLKRQAAPKP